MTFPLDPVLVAKLEMRTRVMRSATAERMADSTTGAPTAQMAGMYRKLAAGNVGLIVTGHACVEMQGRAHHRMAAIDDDALVPLWRDTILPAQKLGAKVMMQINHAGASVDPAVTPDAISPSGVVTGSHPSPGIMTHDDIERIIAAFGQAARRAREAGFDGVQIHGAHGYLTTQFLSSSTNRRNDSWGGESVEQRFTFLGRLIDQVRSQVGDDYPVWCKLGVAGREDSGLSIKQGAQVAKLAASRGVDCLELSHAISEPEQDTSRGEAQYWSMAKAVRNHVGPEYPLALVSGFSTLQGMAQALAGGTIQIISLCRPLIAQPTLLNDMACDASTKAACVRCNQCWPKQPDGYVDCHNLAVRRKLGLPVPA